MQTAQADKGQADIGSENISPHKNVRNAKRAAFEARQRLTSLTGTNISFDKELLFEYTNLRLAGSLALPIMLVILVALSLIWVPLIYSLSWAIAVALSNMFVLYLCKKYQKSDKNNINIRKWSNKFIFAETIYGVSWSFLAFFIFSSQEENLIVIMFAMSIVGIAANAFLSRTLPNATLASTLPIAISICIILISYGGSLSYALAALALGGELFFIYLARQLLVSEIVALEHRAEKDAFISELREARNNSEEARRQAEQANLAKSQFLATMSHELRTPLNAIIGFSEVLKTELLGPHQVPQYKEYASDILESGQHLLNLINELLDLSRIEAGKYELNEEAVSLIDIADDCRRMLDIRAKAKSIEIIFNYDENLPSLWGDGRAIRQVILNLLSNAIKFTPQGGKIELSVRRNSDGGQFISVRDNGPGIPQDEIETVLSSFGQGSLARKSAEQGAGLGLAIVQRIMDLHQGRFDLFSKLRFGTETIATFPKSRTMDALAAVHEKKKKLKIYSEAS